MDPFPSPLYHSKPIHIPWCWTWATAVPNPTLENKVHNSPLHERLPCEADREKTESMQSKRWLWCWGTNNRCCNFMRFVHGKSSRGGSWRPAINGTTVWLGWTGICRSLGGWLNESFNFGCCVGCTYGHNLRLLWWIAHPGPSLLHAGLLSILSQL